MRISIVRILVVLAGTLAAAGGAHAQAFVGVGGGVARVGEPSADISATGLNLHLRAGWSLRPNLSLLLEGSMTGMDSSRPDSTRVITDDVDYYHQFSRTLKTQWVLASVQLGRADQLYVRPGVGVSRHAYLIMQPMSNDVMIEATRWETTPAAGLAVGRELPIPYFPLNLEATVNWSARGDDQTHSRWSTGVQLARVIHF